MLDLFHQRLKVVECDLDRHFGAPTLPIYDTASLPQDAVNGQIVLGTDGSINWYLNDSWNTLAGITSIVGIVPQDVVEGQIVVGSDTSLNWLVNETWYGAVGGPATGNPPQDAVDGQLALGNNGPVWFIDGSWYGPI